MLRWRRGLCAPRLEGVSEYGVVAKGAGSSAETDWLLHWSGLAMLYHCIAFYCFFCIKIPHLLHLPLNVHSGVSCQAKIISCNSA